MMACLVFTVNKTLENVKSNYVINPRVAVLGLTFKSNIDDVRESPFMEIVEKLSHEDINLVSF